jgi:hypothetical protein
MLLGKIASKIRSCRVDSYAPKCWRKRATMNVLQTWTNRSTRSHLEGILQGPRKIGARHSVALSTLGAIGSAEAALIMTTVIIARQLSGRPTNIILALALLCVLVKTCIQEWLCTCTYLKHGIRSWRIREVRSSDINRASPWNINYASVHFS